MARQRDFAMLMALDQRLQEASDFDPNVVRMIFDDLACAEVGHSGATKEQLIDELAQNSQVLANIHATALDMDMRRVLQLPLERWLNALSMEQLRDILDEEEVPRAKADLVALVADQIRHTDSSPLLALNQVVRGLPELVSSLLAVLTKAELCRIASVEKARALVLNARPVHRGRHQPVPFYAPAPMMRDVVRFSRKSVQPRNPRATKFAKLTEMEF